LNSGWTTGIRLDDGLCNNEIIMSVIEKANALEAAGRHQEVVDLVENSARTGDSEALFVLAYWRLWGQNGMRDLAAAHDLLHQAGAGGYREATLLQATLVANGNGVPADWAGGLELLRSISSETSAARQLTLIEAMQLGPDGTPLSLPGAVHVSDRPHVVRMTDFLTRDECNYLIEMARPRLEPSSVVDKQGRLIPHPIRTSEGTSFGPAHEDLVVHAINKRIAALTATQVNWGEPLHMLRYRPGEQYRPHIDAIPGETNQRIQTALLYLNDSYQGGETLFTEEGLTISPRAGDAIVFRNLEADGSRDLSSKHAGLPVISGIKWLATRWIRSGPYHPWGLQT
jgi:prolyl 4-hydroxylase